MTVNSKKKGNLWENKLAKWLTEHGIKAWKDSASGGGNREKGDIGNNVDLTIESKSAKSILLMPWWKQTCESASKHGNTPALFIHQDGMPDNEWLVVMHSEDFVEMLKKSREEKEVVEVEANPMENREVRFKTERAISSLKELLKVLP